MSSDLRSGLSANIELDLSALRADAGEVYWKRGEAYFRGGHAELLTWDALRASAVVRGSEDYRVELRYDPTRQAVDAWRCACDCPLGQDDETCKHIVATALSWQAAFAGEAVEPVAAAGEPPPLAAFLREQSAEVLAERLLLLADDHAEVHRSLQFWMQTAAADSPQALRKALSAMIGSPGHLDWRGNTAFARRLDSLFELLQRTLANDPERALESCDYVLSRLLKIYERADDSSGAIGGRVAELAGLHARAAAAAPGDPGKLAATLLKLQAVDDWGFFTLANYAQALGSAGLERYGSQLRKLWKALLPVPKEVEFHIDSDRILITRLMAQWFEQQADVDGLLELKLDALNNAYGYLDLAQTCLKHGREKAALDWAERGLKAFPADTRLQVLLASFYERDGLVDEALKLRWNMFHTYPAPEHFLALKTSAGDGWPAWRDRALATIKTREVQNQPMPLRQGPFSGSDRRRVSLRVQLHLAEDCLADALAAAAEGHCELPILERLAKAVERDYPDQAVAIYNRLIPARLTVSASRYDDIVKLIRRRARLVETDDARAFEAALRLQHRAKRNFIKLLDTPMAANVTSRRSPSR